MALYSSAGSRREALGILGAGAFALRKAVAADPPLRFTALDHVEFLVSDAEKSAEFYARVFGNTVLKNNKTTRRYVKLGPSYIAMDRNAQGAITSIISAPGSPGIRWPAYTAIWRGRASPIAISPAVRIWR